MYPQTKFFILAEKVLSIIRNPFLLCCTKYRKGIFEAVKTAEGGPDIYGVECNYKRRNAQL